MTELSWGEIPVLRRPVLLMAFGGLFDAADAATDSLGWLRDQAKSQRVIARVDPENFVNFQVTRPMIRINDDDDERLIDWPSTKVWACQTDSERDFVVMAGSEPHFRWNSFARYSVEVARRSGAEFVLTVGSMVAMVPHSRPFDVSGSTIDETLAAALKFSLPSYQGPTGVVGVIHDELRRARIPAASVRVAVPHYVPGAPNPKAMQALLRQLENSTGLTTCHLDFEESVNEWTEKVNRAVAVDDDTASYVATLEDHADSDDDEFPNLDELPSSDEIGDEIEAFLRSQGETPPDFD